MASGFGESSDESSENSNTRISHEYTEDYGRSLEVKDYQFEPKTTRRNQNGEKKVSVYTATKPAEARLSISRVGNTDWLVILQHKCISSLKWDYLALSVEMTSQQCFPFCDASCYTCDFHMYCSGLMFRSILH